MGNTRVINTAEKIRHHIRSKVEAREHILQMPYLIGISGKAGAGKSETAKFLKSIHKYNSHSFAARLKAACAELFGFDEEYYSSHKSEPVISFEAVTSRELYQFFGTEICRNLFGPHFFIWDEASYHKSTVLYQSSKVVYDDVRFQEEADWILECGGTLIHLTRKGADGKVGIPDHASEQGYQTTDTKLYRKGENYYEIENNGTVFDLGYQINKVLAAVRLAQTTI